MQFLAWLAAMAILPGGIVVRSRPRLRLATSPTPPAHPPAPPAPPVELLTPTEKAKQLKVHPVTLFRWREAGVGPEFIRVGPNTIRYYAAPR